MCRKELIFWPGCSEAGYSHSVSEEENYILGRFVENLNLTKVLLQTVLSLTIPRVWALSFHLNSGTAAILHVVEVHYNGGDEDYEDDDDGSPCRYEVPPVVLYRHRHNIRGTMTTFLQYRQSISVYLYCLVKYILHNCGQCQWVREVSRSSPDETANRVIINNNNYYYQRSSIADINNYQWRISINVLSK